MISTRRVVHFVTGEDPPLHESGRAWSGVQKKNDTLMWGQSVSFGPLIDTAQAIGEATVDTRDQQIVRVFYERPTTWQIKVVITAQRPVGESATFEVSYPIIIGVGTAQVTLQRVHAFTVPAPATPEVFEDDLTLPAQAIQISARAVVGRIGSIFAGSHTSQFTALVAPRFQ